ncbi:type II toxin-antitoxin system HicA family toxin [Candidatus Palauibacter sp.]|uniref:type II toxin-antitoxin system HicA family toxin n=1 Tax=Candidatus Palauibacter sp. TaxID=3101350 RepID=UPI003B01574C
MSRRERLVQTILRGRSDANIRFSELRALLRHLGFEERVRGSHHLFNKEGIVEIINLQSRGGHAKPYQVKQVRQLILKYRLGADD